MVLLWAPAFGQGTAVPSAAAVVAAWADFAAAACTHVQLLWPLEEDACVFDGIGKQVLGCVLQVDVTASCIGAMVQKVSSISIQRAASKELLEVVLLGAVVFKLRFRGQFLVSAPVLH